MPRRYGVKNGPTGNAGSERLAVGVLTALGERDGVVRDAEGRAAEALQTMTDDEGFRSPRLPASGSTSAALIPSWPVDRRSAH